MNLKHITFGLMAALLAGCQVAPGQSAADKCSVPTIPTLQDLASYAQLVVDVDVIREVQLKRDSTVSTGHVVRIQSIRRGTVPKGVEEIAIWSNPSTRIVTGRQMTLFLLPRKATTSDDGKELSNFSPVSGGSLLLSQDSEKFSQTCRDSVSPQVNNSVLTQALK